MQDYKNNKILELIKEIVKVPDQTDYEINGVDTSRAIYFYRKEKEKFKIIPLGSYTIVDEASNKYLRITDSSLLGEAIEFQICYLFVKTSSSYVDEFPEITLLQEHYNQLYDDFNNLLNQLKSNNILGDTLKMSYVLPQLNEGQVWVLRQGEMKAENIFDLDERLKEALEQFKILFSKWIDEIEKPRFESFVDEKIQIANDELDGKTELEKIELEDYTEQKKNELDIYLTGRKPIQYATIAELQASTNLKIGDYVELAGYYSVGDGANHKRIISNSDDGSGVRLTNGLWANLLDKRLRFFGKKLCFIGDSITEATEALVLKNYIKNKFGFSEFESLAVSGSTLTSGNIGRGTFQTQAENASVCDLYIVWGGVNDFVSSSDIEGTDTKSLRIAVSEIIRKLQSKNPNSEIIFFTPLPQFWWSNGRNANTKGYTLEDYTQAIKESCLLNSIPCIDLTSNSNINIYNKEVFLKDGVHPNKDGYNKILPIFYNSILNTNCTTTKKSFNILRDKGGTQGETSIAELVDETTGDIHNFLKGRFHEPTNQCALYLAELTEMVKSFGFVFGGNSLFFQKDGMYENNFKIITENIQESELNTEIYYGNSLVIQIGQAFVNSEPTPINVKEVKKVLFATVVPVTKALGFIQTNIVETSPTSFKAKASQESTPCFFLRICIKNEEIVTQFEINNLNTPYYTEKMKNEGVYDDFISFMDSKVEYDNRKREEKKNLQEAYKVWAESNPDGTYEEFINLIPNYNNLMLLPEGMENTNKEPQPSEALLKFKEKYLG